MSVPFACGARRLDRPEPGYWRMTLVKGGPLVPAKIAWVQTLHEPGDPFNMMERSGSWYAEIAGEPVHWSLVWERRGEPISRADYDFMLDTQRWAQEHDPTNPRAAPRQKVDLMTAPLPQWRTR